MNTTSHTLPTTTSQPFGSIKVHANTLSFGFQIQLNLQPSTPNQVVEFALTSQTAPTPGQFSIQLDLQSGVLTDNINQTGVIGKLHQNLLNLSQRHAPLLLRWTVDHHGGALIPRLEIGEEEWLYPAVRFAPNCQYLATASSSHHNNQFSQAYVWCQDRLKK